MQSLAKISLFVFLSSVTRPASSLSVAVAEQWQWPWSKKHKETEAKPAETTPAPAVRGPSKPGCYMRMPSGCPNKPMKTQQWRHDTWAEGRALDEAECQQRKSIWDGFCGSEDAEMVYVANTTRSEPLSALQIASEWQWPWSKKRKETEAKPAEAEAQPAEAEAKPAETTQASAASAEAAVPDPTQPGCYMRMPSGCPKKPMRTMLWRHDTWAEQHELDEAACQQRKSVWDGYCDSKDAKMIFLPKQ